MISAVGLPMKPTESFFTNYLLANIWIVVDINNGFSIEQSKLDEICVVCLQAFLRDFMTKREFQSLLGKLLYVSRCVKTSRIFLNCLLMTLCVHKNSNTVHLDCGTCKNLLWFLTFMTSFN